MGNLLRKIFERPYTFKQNGYDRNTPPSDMRPGDKVEYAVTATDGLAYTIESLDNAIGEATVRSNTSKSKQYKVPLVMLRKIS